MKQIFKQNKINLKFICIIFVLFLKSSYSHKLKNYKNSKFINDSVIRTTTYSDYHYGVKIIIPGVRAKDLFISQITSKDGFKSINIVRNNNTISTNKVFKETPLIIHNGENELMYYTDVLPDNDMTSINPNLFKTANNCFFIKNKKTGLYLTYSSDSDSATAASLRPFKRWKTQILCTVENRLLKMINLCFKETAVCLFGQTNNFLSNKKQKFIDINYTKRNNITSQNYSLFSFYPDYNSDDSNSSANDVKTAIPNTGLFTIKTEMEEIMLSVKNGIVMAQNIYDGDNSSNAVSDIYNKWSIFLAK